MATRISQIDDELRAALACLPRGGRASPTKARDHLVTASNLLAPLVEAAQGTASIPPDAFPSLPPFHENWVDPDWPKGYTCPKCKGTKVHATTCPIVIERRARGG